MQIIEKIITRLAWKILAIPSAKQRMTQRRPILGNIVRDRTCVTTKKKKAEKALETYHWPYMLKFLVFSSSEKPIVLL